MTSRFRVVLAVLLGCAVLLSACSQGKPAENSSAVPPASDASDTPTSGESTTATEDATTTASASDATTTKATTTATKKPSTTTYEEVAYALRDEAKALGMTEAVMKRALINEGNRTRVANVIRKALRGEPVTIATLGGSITEGYTVSSTTCFAGRLRTWWSKTFPDSRLTFINAGFTNTDSMIGVFRMKEAILDRNPDLMILEFCVNDGGNGADTATATEAYESIVRRTLNSKNAPAVMLLFMMREDGSQGNRENHQKIGKLYNLPMFSYKEAVWPDGGQKLYEWNKLSGDDVHPNNTGHSIIAELFIDYFNHVRADLNSIPSKVDTKLPSPMTKSRFEKATLLLPGNTNPVSLGSFTLAPANSVAQYPMGWVFESGKDPLVFDVKDASQIYLMYMFNGDAAGGKMLLKVDGTTAGTVDTSHALGWAAAVKCAKILTDGKRGTHRIEITPHKNGRFVVFGIMVA